MRKLKDDSINLWRGVTRAERPRVRLALPALMLVAMALMVLSRLDHSAIRYARAGLGEAMAPVFAALMVPVDEVRAAGRRLGALQATGDEVEQLKARNRQLEAQLWRARDIERQFTELTRQTRTVLGSDPGAVTTRVLAQSGGAFTRSVMLEAGREHGLKPGHPVVTIDGLAGRIVEAGRRTASVLLVTDVNSRVPVSVGQGSVRAVMVGDNGPNPRLSFIGEGVLRDGDAVATSGVGGLFPRGLRVGTVVHRAGVARVEPVVSLDDLTFVQVLLFDSDTLQLAGERAAVGAQADKATMSSAATATAPRAGGRVASPPSISAAAAPASGGEATP